MIIPITVLYQQSQSSLEENDIGIKKLIELTHLRTAHNVILLAAKYMPSLNHSNLTMSFFDVVFPTTN